MILTHTPMVVTTTLRQFAIGATTLIILTHALLMGITGRSGSLAASLSVQARGTAMDGAAGATRTATAAIAAIVAATETTDIVAVMDIAATRAEAFTQVAVGMVVEEMAVAQPIWAATEVVTAMVRPAHTAAVDTAASVAATVAHEPAVVLAVAERVPVAASVVAAEQVAALAAVAVLVAASAAAVVDSMAVVVAVDSTAAVVAAPTVVAVDIAKLN